MQLSNALSVKCLYSLLRISLNKSYFHLKWKHLLEWLAKDGIILHCNFFKLTFRGSFHESSMKCVLGNGFTWDKDFIVLVIIRWRGFWRSSVDVTVSSGASQIRHTFEHLLSHWNFGYWLWRVEFLNYSNNTRLLAIQSNWI